MSAVSSCRRRAIKRCLDDFLGQCQLMLSSNNKNSSSSYWQQQSVIPIGMGSGSTMDMAMEEWALGYYSLWNHLFDAKNDKKQLVFVPSSFQAKQRLVEYQLPTGTLEQYPRLYWGMDGADECDAQLNLIKGGGGCHLQEKLIAQNSDHWVIVVDYLKVSTVLGQRWTKGIPLEIHPMTYTAIPQRLSAKTHSEDQTASTNTQRPLICQSSNLRMGLPGKAGPCVTDNGNFILDVVFDEQWMRQPEALNRRLLEIAGILETGLFVDMVDKIYVGTENEYVE